MRRKGGVYKEKCMVRFSTLLSLQKLSAPFWFVHRADSAASNTDRGTAVMNGTQELVASIQYTSTQNWAVRETRSGTAECAQRQLSSPRQGLWRCLCRCLGALHGQALMNLCCIFCYYIAPTCAAYSYIAILGFIGSMSCNEAMLVFIPPDEAKRS